MGLLDQAMSALGGSGGGGGQGGQQQNLVVALMKVANSPQVGGVGGLLSKLHAGGLGGPLQSWIGTGANQPVSGQQVSSALGQQHVDEFAREAGVPPQQASDALAGLLPGLIDKMTPHGQLPSDVTAGGGAGLMDLLKGMGGLGH